MIFRDKARRTWWKLRKWFITGGIWPLVMSIQFQHGTMVTLIPLTSLDRLLYGERFMVEFANRWAVPADCSYLSISNTIQRN